MEAVLSNSGKILSYENGSCTNGILNHSSSSNASGSIKRARILDESDDEDHEDFKEQGHFNQSVDSLSNASVIRNIKRVRILDDSDDENTIPDNKILHSLILDLPSSPKAMEKVKKSRILDDSEDEDSGKENGVHFNETEGLSPSSNFAENIKRPRILDDSENEDSEKENGIHSNQLDPSSSNVGENEVPSVVFPGDNMDQEEEKVCGNKISNTGKIRDDFVLKTVPKQRKSENGKFNKLMQSRQSKLKKKDKAKLEKEELKDYSEVNSSPEKSLPLISLDADIFDAEGTDDENEIQTKNTFKENASGVDWPSEDEDAGLEKLKKGKKEKKKRESKKARNQELMEIHSESQRLLRETSIKLPYHKPPKLSLIEFLDSRKKPSFPLDIKPFRSDTNRILALKNSVISQKENTNGNVAQSNALNCESSVKPEDAQPNSVCIPINLEPGNSYAENEKNGETDVLASQSSINGEDTTSNILTDQPGGENFMPLVLDLEKSTSILENSINATEEARSILEDLGNLVENSLNDLVNTTNPLENSTNILNASNSLSSTSDEKVDMKLRQASELENLSSDDDLDALKIVLGESCGDLHLSTSNPSADVCETEPHQTDFDILKKRAIDSVKSFTPRLSGSPNDIIILDLGASSPPAENDFDNFIQKFVNHANGMHKKRLNQDVKLSIVSKDETDSTKLLHSEICVNVSGINEEPEFEKPGVKYLKLKEKLLDEILKKKEAAFIKKQELEELDNEIQPDMDEEEAELTDDSDLDQDMIDDDDVNKKDTDNIDAINDNADDIHANDEVDDDDIHTNDEVDDDSMSISFPRKRKKNLFIQDEASVSEDNNRPTSLKSTLIDDSESRSSSTSKTSCESQVSFSGIFPKGKFSSEVYQQDRAITSSEPIGAEIDSNTQFIVPSNRACTPSDDTKASNCPDNHRILFKKELSNKNQDTTLLDDSQPICTFSNLVESPSQSGNELGFSPNIKGLLSGGSPTGGINDELLALCSGAFTGVNETNIPRLAKELCFDTSPPDIADVLDVCSGTFNSRTLPALENVADEDSEDSLPETSKHKMKSALSDLDDDSVPSPHNVSNNLSFESNDEKDDDDDALSEKSERAFPENGKQKPADFFEDEAELSGDDVGSDADEDVDDGEYEEDFIPDEELPSDEELRDQIGKVHLKHLLDDDKRELRLYQELYLEDGELHDDGPGRQRKFTWQNSNVDNFMGNNSSNSESENDDAHEDEKWRLERYERQKFLHEQQQNKDKQLENSPIKSKWNNSVNIKILHKTQEPVVVAERNESDSANISTNSILKTSGGSILARGEDFLNSLSKKFKVNDESVGFRTTKHFVFRTISPKKAAEPIIAISAEKRPKKKQLLKMQNLKKRRSIFDLLDDDNA